VKVIHYKQANMRANELRKIEEVMRKYLNEQ